MLQMQLEGYVDHQLRSLNGLTLSTALIISWCSSKEVIWALEPAAMLLSAQQASLRMPFFTWVTRGAIASRPWASTTAWVCKPKTNNTFVHN